MEFHQLRYFVAVARAGSFTRAATSCFVSQPSLSQQIKKLEEELGEPLVHRMRHQATLTEAGKLFLQRASRVLREIEEAQRELAEHTGLRTGAVRIGVIPTAAPFLIPPALGALATDYPGLHGIVVEEPSERLLEMLARCELDFAIVSLPAGGQGWHAEPLVEEELLLGVASRHRLARGEAPSLAELRKEPFILMKSTHSITRIIDEACAGAGFQPSVVFRTSQLLTIGQLVGAGMGVSVFPALAARGESAPGVVFRRLRTPAPCRRLAALWHKSSRPSSAAGLFLQKLKDTIRSELTSETVHALGD